MAEASLVKLHRNVQFNLWWISAAPLFNVVFLVLAFYTLSDRFELRPGLQVSLPVTSFSMVPKRDAEIVSVTSAPVPAIYFRDSKVSFDELVSMLREQQDGDRAIILRADRQAPYELVTRITNAALQNGYSVMLAGGAAP